MDTNLDIYEPLKLAGSMRTSSFDLVHSGEEEINRDNYCEPTTGSFTKMVDLVNSVGSIKQIWRRSELDVDNEEENDDVDIVEEEVEEEEDESVADCRSALPTFSSISESVKAGWATFRLANEPWANHKRPVVQILNYNDMELTEDECNGILSDRIIAACSSCLDKNPESLRYCLAKVELQGKQLEDITILEAHRYLQYIDLSFNKLSDISALSGIPYLMYLDVSNNQLTDVLRFDAPWNLIYVDYSCNNVETIGDLSHFWSIEYLSLANNSITKIEGLQNLRYLTDLDLSYNNIEILENLNNLHIQNLNIHNNKISTFEEGPDVGLKTMMYLYYINLSSNNLTSLELFKGVYHVRIADLKNNQIAELQETSHLKTMHLLNNLNLSDNLLTQWPNYREVICYTVPSLCYLDDVEVTIHEKVSAKNLFAPTEQLRVAQNHARQLLLEELNDPSLELDTLPIDQGPYPLVALVGPPGSNKRDLVTFLAVQFPNKIHVGVSHTTRKKDEIEENGVHYHFVTQEEFNELSRNGAFLCISEFHGRSYGLSRQEMAKAVKANKLCITHMDLISALTLNHRGLQAHLLLVMLESEDVHIEQLKLKFEGKHYNSVTSISQPRKTTSDQGTKSAHSDMVSDILEELLWEKVYKTADGEEFQLTSSLELLEFYSKGRMSQINSDIETPKVTSNPKVEDIVLDNTKVALKKKKKKKKTRDPKKAEAGHSGGLNEEKLPGSIISLYSKRLLRDMPEVPFLRTPITADNIGQLANKSHFSDGFIIQSNRVQSYQDTRKAFSCPEILRGAPIYPSFVEFDEETNYYKMEEILMSNAKRETQISSLFYGTPLMRHSTTRSVLLSGTSKIWNRASFSWHPVLKDTDEDNLKTEPEATSESSLDIPTESLAISEEGYIRSVMKTRESYVKIHHENPGFFADAIYSDNLQEAFHKLYCHVKNTFISHPKRLPVFKFEDDPAYKLMIPRRLELLSQEINRTHSTMEKQINDLNRENELKPIKQRSTFRIEEDMGNNSPRPRSRKCNLPF